MDRRRSRRSARLRHARRGRLSPRRTSPPPRRRSVRRSSATGAGWGPPSLQDFSGAESLPTRYFLARAQLKLALSQARAGDRDRALATYQEVIDLTSELAVAALQGAADDHLIQTRYHALAQRGDLLLADRRYDEAVRSYDEAISLSNVVNQYTPGGEAMLTGAAESNRALALLRAGRAGGSVASARQALARDPDNPIFIEAYASALRESGDTEAAISAYRRALAVDPTLFTAQNNLGVAAGPLRSAGRG